MGLAMRRVYVYQAAVYCEPCGTTIRERLTAEGRAPADPRDEYSYNSGDYPKGPEPVSEHEADSPQHCDACGEFLENPLTCEGLDYVREAVTEGLKRGGKSVAVTTWRAFYGIEGSTES